MKSPRNQLILLCAGFASLIGLAAWIAFTAVTPVQAQGPQSTNSSPPIQLTTFVFNSPLIPINPDNLDLNETTALAGIFTDAQESLNQALASTTNKSSARRAVEWATMNELEDFLATRPQSAWAPSVRNQLGAWYRAHAQNTKALAHFETNWNQTKNLQSRVGKREGDIAYANYTRMLVILGRMDTLSNFYQEYGLRTLDYGALSQNSVRTHEKFLRVQARPQLAFKCGIYSLDRVALAMGLTIRRSDLLKTHGKPEGTSLKELDDLSARSKLAFALFVVPLTPPPFHFPLSFTGPRNITPPSSLNMAISTASGILPRAVLSF